MRKIPKFDGLLARLEDACVRLAVATDAQLKQLRSMQREAHDRVLEALRTSNTYQPNWSQYPVARDYFLQNHA